MFQASKNSIISWSNLLKGHWILFQDGSPVTLKIPQVVQSFMADNWLVVGGYVRDGIAKILHQGGQLALSDQQHKILAEQKLVPQKYLPREKPFLDIDLITGSSDTELRAKGFKPTLLPNCYTARRSDKDVDQVIKIGVLRQENFILETEIKERDFYVNTFFMDREGLVYDVSGLALLGVLTKTLVTVNPDPLTTLVNDGLKLLRGLYFHASDSYHFAGPLQKAIQEIACNTKVLQKAWDNISSDHRFSLWGRYFGEGFAADTFATLEKSNLLSFFFPPISNDAKQECNQWIKARLAELDRGDYYHLERPTEYFYAILIAAMDKYSTTSISLYDYLKYWGIPKSVTISQPLIAEFAACSELTIRAKPKNRQVDLLRIVELKAAKLNKSNNTTIISVSEPATPYMASASSAQGVSSSQSTIILSETNSPLMLPAAVMTTSVNASEMIHSITPPAATATSICSPLTLPVRVMDAIPPLPLPIVWLASEPDRSVVISLTTPSVSGSSTQETAVETKSSTINSTRSAAVILSSKTEITCATSDTAATNSASTSSTVVSNAKSKKAQPKPKLSQSTAVGNALVLSDVARKNRSLSATQPRLRMPGKKQLQHQEEMEAKKQLLAEWREQLERERRIEQQKAAAKKQHSEEEKLRKEEQKNLAEKLQRKLQSETTLVAKSVASNISSSSIPTSTIANTITSVPLLPTISASLASNASTTAATTTMLDSISSTMTSLACMATTMSKEIGSASSLAATAEAKVTSKEVQESKQVLPQQIYMRDCIDGPIYSLSREDFIALDIKLTQGGEAKLISASQEYGCCYCGPIAGWRVCRCDTMAEIQLTSPDKDEIISLHFAPKKHTGHIGDEVGVFSAFVWKSLMNGHSICLDDQANSKKIFIAHDAMLRIFKQSRYSKSSFTVQRDEYSVIPFDAWEKHLLQNFNNELLAACEVFNPQPANSFLPTSVIALLNSVLGKAAFWHYAKGIYSCNLYPDQICLFVDNVNALTNDNIFESSTLDQSNGNHTFCLTKIDVEQLALVERRLREARQKPKSRCCDLIGCTML